MKGLELNYQRSGSGAPLIIVHGVFGSLTNWRSIAKRLEGDFDILNADLRNHGDSPHAPDMSYHAMAEDVARLIDTHFDGERVNLIGHSMGGKVMMTLALLRPQLVNRLVVVDIAPVAYSKKGIFAGYLRAMADLDLNIDSRREADTALAQYIPEASFRGFLLQNLRRNEDGWGWRINLDAIADQLDSIRGFPDFDRPSPVPTCFLRGGNSGYVRDKHFPAIQRLFPEHSIETVEGAGHWVHAEDPDATERALRNWLA